MSAYVTDPNAVQFVRAFVDALLNAVTKHDYGVSLVAHRSKGAHKPKDADPAGAAAGSAASTDAAYGVRTFEHPPRRSQKEAEDAQGARLARRKLPCVKANYSRQVDCEPAEHANGQEFCGFEVRPL